MSDKSKFHSLDTIDWKILEELQEKARIPFAELARRVGLSTPAAAERVHKLEDDRIITGYRAEVDSRKIGFPLLGFVRVSLVGEALPRFPEKAAKLSEVLEVHRVTGSESFIIKVAVRHHEHLQAVLDALMPYIATTTSIVLTSFLSFRSIACPGHDHP